MSAAFLRSQEPRDGPFHAGLGRGHVEGTKRNHGSPPGKLYRKEKRHEKHRVSGIPGLQKRLGSQSTMQSPALSAGFLSGLNVQRKNKTEMLLHKLQLLYSLVQDRKRSRSPHQTGSASTRSHVARALHAGRRSLNRDPPVLLCNFNSGTLRC